ncbi:MAG TPA: amidohydrolase family protein [Acidimicrobiales bacterium]|nr:amidohydrolase family protein [Acidimicrobiales bacterium]
MATLSFPIVDADNHYYEPRDAFTRYMEPAHRDGAVHVRQEPDGTERIFVGDRPFTFLTPLFDNVAPPGSLREMLRNLSSGSISDNSHSQPIQPEYVGSDARLRTMDRQGVGQALLLPSLGVCVEHFMADPAQTMANLRAFNRWLDDDWGFARQDRIFAVPLLSLRDLGAAVEELRYVLDHGARVVHLRPGPVDGRSLADPVFDPFWGLVNESGVAVAFHISESGYNEMYSTRWGEEPNPASHHQSAFQWTFFYGDRPIMETLGALVLHNLFGRFPNVRVLSVENGSLWVPYLMKAMDKMKGMGRNGPWLGGRVAGRPSEIFREHVYVSPYHEEDIVSLAGLIGTDRVVMGSDFPHPEGLAEPSDFADALAPLGDEAVRKIMRDNGRSLISAP